MKPFARKLIISAATAATVVATIPMAEARDRHFGRDHRAPIVRNHHPIVRSHNNAGGAVAAGIIGLALGAVIVGTLSRHQNANPYRHPRPSPERNFFPAAPNAYAAGNAYAGSLEPWTPGWYRYCAQRYRSFIPATGTFTTYGGEKRFCVAE